ncbi:hypothetical protein NDU88_003803 [Pleurodeles waltl]|uniref:Uncharacterized protein n=1 Tax=Pleurodeles waltl TaxID=8319 RepID=A0AAV7UD41_PLEWA|nr:hypothetical protein NDU88_003803 [Pleurodeles waltl]
MRETNKWVRKKTGKKQEKYLPIRNRTPICFNSDEGQPARRANGGNRKEEKPGHYRQEEEARRTDTLEEDIRCQARIGPRGKKPTRKTQIARKVVKLSARSGGRLWKKLMSRRNSGDLTHRGEIARMGLPVLNAGPIYLLPDRDALPKLTADASNTSYRSIETDGVQDPVSNSPCWRESRVAVRRHWGPSDR